MTRRFAALALSTALVVTFLAHGPAAAVTSAPIPTSMAAVGDSITQAASSAGSLGADAPQNSWSTGTSTTVNSHFLRLRQLSPGLVAHNRSVSGAKVVHLEGQMDTVVALDPDPGFLTVLIGGNDLCTDTVAQMTSVSDFRAHFTAAMTTITTESPGTYVYVASIPDVWQLWNLFKNNFWARFIWSSAGICQSLLANPTSTQQADRERREQVRQRNRDYNNVLEQVCESAAFAHRCLFDNHAVFNTQFTTSDVSGDYFHPSVAGQAKLASVTWAAGYAWTSSTPANQPPTASFTHSCADLACQFTDASSDTDGTITSRSWSFGDGATSTATNPSHTYAAGGTYTVTLTVTDDDGAPATVSYSVTVSEPSEPPANVNPVADFAASCDGLACSFTDASSDSDGAVASRSWSFGDGATSTATNPSHTYATGGTYTVTLTVTDDDGGTNSASQTVTVSAPTSISLSVTPYKVKGIQHADLSWLGASSTDVDVIRDGTRIATTANDGGYTDNIGQKGGGSHTYKVCQAGTTTCSPVVTVSY